MAVSYIHGNPCYGTILLWRATEHSIADPGIPDAAKTKLDSRNSLRENRPTKFAFLCFLLSYDLRLVNISMVNLWKSIVTPSNITRLPSSNLKPGLRVADSLHDDQVASIEEHKDTPLLQDTRIQSTISMSP